MIQFYGYPNCSTCQKAFKQLTQTQTNVQYINVKTNPPTVSTLQQIINLANVTINQLFNSHGKIYQSQNLKQQLPHMSDAEKLELLASNGMLIKRPLIVSDKHAIVGNKLDTVYKL